jgi:PAS domain S-box-containing protein
MGNTGPKSIVPSAAAGGGGAGLRPAGADAGQGRAAILLVDDRPQNLLALEAILEPLGHELVTAGSGEEALKRLLRRDFAVILLDVQMPRLDGFETARLIKGRERTRDLPIIFLTAYGKDAAHVFRGYSAGAVDYLFKPFDPEVLRSKVAVFVELWEKRRQLLEQAERLRERDLAAARRASEERYRRLAEAMPAIVWQAEPQGSAFYYNQRWFDYTGIAPEEAAGDDWHRVIHPDDLAPTLARWDEASASGAPFTMAYRFRAADGSYRWHLGRAVPERDGDGRIVSWIGAAADIDDQKRAEERQRFLVEAGAALGSSLDYRRTLAHVARAAVPDFADWCTVDILEPDGELRRLEIAHEDPRKLTFARELQERYPPGAAASSGPRHVVQTGESELMTEIPADLLRSVAVDDLHLDLLTELGLRSYVCVPLVARERTFGALTFVQAESGRSYDATDLALAEELARRAAAAIDNAQLFEQAESRARAAQVLATVGDGVFQLDAAGVIRLWNPAAEAITGLAAEDVVGRAAREAIPRWDELAGRISVASGPGEAGPAETLPVEIGARELWLSFSGVGSEEGTVYAFRDLTEQRALEAMRSEFVATVSHELRTPLAAIHGAALTILRPDLELDDEMSGRLLRVIADESRRLAEIVNDLLVAGHLDAGGVGARIERCDPRELAERVLEAASTHIPPGIDLQLSSAEGVPEVAADREHLRQVLANLVDNAIKYSPDGGPVAVEIAPRNAWVRFTVRDRGLGIPRSEHARVFEKFYRLDPNMTRGIGGTGLGLYISRQLVETMDGRIWVESENGEGSTFVVEIPAAEAGPKKRRARAPAES